MRTKKKSCKMKVVDIKMLHQNLLGCRVKKMLKREVLQLVFFLRPMKSEDFSKFKNILKKP